MIICMHPDDFKSGYKMLDRSDALLFGYDAKQCIFREDLFCIGSINPARWFTYAIAAYKHHGLETARLSRC
jgi:hypothetical protein